MTSPSDIKSHFFLNRDKYDAEIFIQIQCRDPELRRHLMESIFFDTSDDSLDLQALAEERNTTTLCRRIYAKKLIDLKK